MKVLFLEQYNQLLERDLEKKRSQSSPKQYKCGENSSASTVREEQNLKTPTEDLNSKNQLEKLNNITDTPHHVREFPSSALPQQLTGGDDNHANIDVILSSVNNENQIKAKKFLTKLCQSSELTWNEKLEISISKKLFW
jgi:uncharacterized membrane protein YdfJ with MMPL/SSD domain